MRRVPAVCAVRSGCNGGVCLAFCGRRRALRNGGDRMAFTGFEKAAVRPSSVPEGTAFNFLRLACCLVVLYEHCAVLSGVDFPCYDLRGTAVNVFFILSGFWVTQSFLKSGSVKEYAIKRYRKILPQYWLVVLACALALSAFSVLPLREYFCSGGFYKYLAANFSALNFLCPNLPGVFEGLPLGGSVNGSLWTIKVEVGFYLILPLIARAVRRADEKLHGGGTPSFPRCTCFPFCGRRLCRL